MKIVSWNVNSIRVRLEHLEQLIQKYSPDIILIQETRVQDSQFPFEFFENFNYNIEISGQKTRNGVCIFSKNVIEDVLVQFDEKNCNKNSNDVFFYERIQTEKRFIQAFINPITIANVYIPQGQQIDTDEYFYKLYFLQRLIHHLQQNKLNNFILAGDFNIIKRPIDSYDQAYTDIMATQSERQKIQEIESLGFYDSMHGCGFTWWGYMQNAFVKNKGFRIDNFFISNDLVEKIKHVQVLKDLRSLERPSDHAPLLIELDVS